MSKNKNTSAPTVTTSYNCLEIYSCDSDGRPIP